MHHQYTVEILVGKTWHKIQHHQNYIHLIWDLSVHYWTFQRRQQFMNLFAKKKENEKQLRDETAKNRWYENFQYSFGCVLSIRLLAGWLTQSLYSFALRHRNRSDFVFSFSLEKRKKQQHWNICTFSVARSIRQFILQWLLFGIFMRIILIWLNNKWMYNS